ncbi:hypothetical protein EAI30_03555 [Romboutsia ilealis]|uniref:Uncharacterized protein n=1 Tax=Romboutsia faecis TaxID=2764597 RepID=A0ABR7JKN4_9FIRM|nr:hypothetical protein [Romboutsia faecis]MBC5995487.1 hypothetical protein [Romboutsia faecis]MRN23688.1 hypothetical protein [Romboutsia ilealis]
MSIKNKYSIIEKNDISGTRVIKQSLIVKIANDLSRDEIISIARDIIESEVGYKGYIMILMSDKDDVISRDEYGWTAVAHWKAPESSYEISSVIMKNLEPVDGIYFEF